MKNVVINNDMIKYIYTLIEEIGLITVLNSLFVKNIRVSLSFSQKISDYPIEVLYLSVRSKNALYKANIKTINDLITLLNNREIKSVKKLGRKSIMEIKTALLQFGYYELSEEEKLKFIELLIYYNT